MARRDVQPDAPITDPWGRPFGDPDYGKDPNATPTTPPPVETNPPPPPAPPPPPPGAPSIGPFTGQFTAPPRPGLPGVPIPDLPGYTPPPAFQYADYTPGDPFRAPSVEEALQDPGYKFRLGQGEEALQHWAAARGTLNDSGTAKALLEHGQNAASQEYRNVWDRGYNAYNLNEGNRFKTYMTNRTGAVDTYNTNYQTQFMDPYKFKYQAALDRFAPQLEGWRTNAAYTQHASDMDYSNAWNQYLNQWEQWKDRRNTGIGLAGA